MLNAEGHRTSRGKAWTDTGVSNLLTCSSVVGRYWVNKTRKLPSGKRVVRPEREWTPVPCERLIDDETWEATQRILREQKAKGGAPRPGKHAFAGIFFRQLRGEMTLPTRTPRLACPACRNKIPLEDLEGVFLAELDEFLASRSSQLTRMVDSGDAKPDPDRQLLEARLADARKRQARVNDLILADQITVERFGELNEPLEKEIRSLEREITRVERKVKATRRCSGSEPESRRAGRKRTGAGTESATSEIPRPRPRCGRSSICGSAGT